MRDNDIVFMNLHRRYQDSMPSFGGFLGIYVLSAWVNANGYSGQGFAGTLHEGRIIVDNLCLNGKVRIIGLYCDYANVTDNIVLSSYIKEKYNIPVIVGGPQATALGEDFLKKSKCDVLSFYEGELTTLELLDYFLEGVGELAQIKSIAYLEDDEIKRTPFRDLIHNLDALPFIDEDCYLIPREDWSELSIMTGRGCPFRCSFCHEGKHSKTVRLRSVENVLEEIRINLSRMPKDSFRTILFVDDTFTLKPERVKEICEGLKELRKEYRFVWFCEGHVGMIRKHPEMIAWMVEAGCWRVQIGIEAGTEEVLSSFRKNIVPDDIREVVAMCRDGGVNQVFGNIIIGAAHFSKEIYERDLQFARELLELGQGTLELNALSFWPLPETELTTNPKKYGIKIVDYDFVTTVDDFPQTETEDYDVWGLLECVQNMRAEIFNTMMKMIKERTVPESRIISWLSQDGENFRGGIWLNTLRSALNIYNWYHLLSIGECITSKDFTIEDYLECRPMRVVAIDATVSKNEDGQRVMFGNPLTVEEMNVLIYSTGKLMLKEMFPYIKVRHPLLELSSVVSILKKLEELYLIIFCKE